jgi:VWFA-related protein
MSSQRSLRVIVVAELDPGDVEMIWRVPLISLSFALMIARNSVNEFQNANRNTGAPVETESHAQSSVDPQLKVRPAGSSSRSTRLTMDVVVTDKAGNTITGLSELDVQLLDNKVPVKVEAFKASSRTSLSDGPSSKILLVVDAINSSQESLARTYSQIQNVLDVDGGRLKQPVEILILSDTQSVTRNAQDRTSETVALANRQAFVQRIAASTDGLALAKTLQQIVVPITRMPDAQGAEGESEKARLSVQALNAIGTTELLLDGPKTLIWLSPGWSPFARSTKTQPALFNAITYFADLLRDARITLDFVDTGGVFAGAETTLPPPPNASELVFQNRAVPLPVGQPNPNWYEEYYRPVAKESQANMNDLALQVLAYQSGGVVLVRNNQIAQQILRCMNDARSSYELSFEPSTIRDGAYHDVELRIKRRNATARFRRGYYAR